MPKVKTAISLQESIVERMDRLARELRVSRSQLFSRAADEFLRRHQAPALLEAIDRALGNESPDPGEKDRLRAARINHRRLVEGEW